MGEEGEKRQRANEAYSIRVSAFPSELWKEWEENCKEHYNDCRWVKIWSDHLRAKDADKFEAMAQRIAELEMLIRNTKEEKKEDGFVETMGGKVKKGGD